MAITNYLAEKIINKITSVKTDDIIRVTRPNNATHYSEVWVGLHVGTNPPTPAGFFSEPNAENGYKRVLLGKTNEPSSLKMLQAANKQAVNKEFVFFPEVVGASWGVCTHFLLFSEESSGQVLIAYGELTDGQEPPTATPVTPDVGDVPILRPGDLKIKVE